MKRILIVEDDEDIASIEKDYLEVSGYQVHVEINGTRGLTEALSSDYDLILLDIMLPGMDGFQVVHELRHTGMSVPVLMLTARTTTLDKVEGLDSGADDYMTKPFEAPELLARIRALTRRQGDVVIDEATFGDLTLDLNTHDLSCSSRSVHLSQKEFEVMRMLMSSTGRVVSKSDLLTSVWGADGEASENSAEAYVSFLRKKLSHLRSSVSITTLRMLGYRLEQIQTGE